MTIHIESFAERLEELKELLPIHYEELALNKDKVPLSPQFEEYIRREQQGSLLFVTLRDQGKLTGYYIGFIAPGLHYQTCLTCITDIFFVRPDQRAGINGVKLFRFVEKELKRRGVQRWFVGEKLHSGAAPLLKRIGLEPVECTHSKWLGD